MYFYAKIQIKQISLILLPTIFCILLSFLFYDYLTDEDTQVLIAQQKRLPTLEMLSSVERQLATQGQDPKILSTLAKSYLARAQLRQTKDDYLRALKAFYKLSKITPSTQLNLQIVRIMLILNNTDYPKIPPIHYFLYQILDSEPNNLEAVIINALNYRNLGIFEQARLFYNKALNLVRPNSTQFLAINAQLDDIVTDSTRFDNSLKINFNQVNKMKLSDGATIYLLLKKKSDNKTFLTLAIPFKNNSINMRLPTKSITYKNYFVVSYISNSGLIEDISSNIFQKQIDSSLDKLVINF